MKCYCVTPQCIYRPMAHLPQESTWMMEKFWCTKCNRISFCRSFLGKVCETAPLVIAAAAIVGILGIELPDADSFDHFPDGS